MAFTQQTFLGATISSFRVSLGFGGENSQLTVDLIEDPAQNDQFNPTPGAPVYFTYDSFEFGGLLQSYTAKGDISGNPVYEVTVVDPRALLEGTQLILNGYTGGIFNMPNLINVYGYWESQGFGASEVNETGMKWGKIVSGIAGAGISIRFNGYSFGINLSALPNIPADYRIGGDTISLMDFVDEVCKAASHDYFFRMDQFNTIYVGTTNHSTQPQLGMINRYVNNTPDAIIRTNGVEMRNETMGKFVVGGNVEQVYLQQEQGTEASATIWPYWGLRNGVPVIGTGDFDDNDHQMVLDARAINVVGVGSTYKTDVGELRCALFSYGAWLEFLSCFNDEPGQHKDKLTRLGFKDGYHGSADLWNLVQGGKLGPFELTPRKDKQAELKRKGIKDNKEENIQQLYEAVRAFAGEYYGRKFMVRIPFVYVKKEPDTDRIVTSQEPTDGGFVEESVWPTAISQNLLPADVNKVTTEDGKVECYVRFDNADTLDLSELSEDDYAFGNNNTIFVRGTLDPKIYFLDNNTLFSPRVVVTLNAVVRYSTPEEDATDTLGLLRLLLNKNNEPDVKKKIDEFIGAFGSEGVFFGMKGMAVMPDLAATPLKSNILTYGPWYGIGAQGKMEFEKNESLVPWNYGGFTAMNVAGDALVTDAISYQTLGETGSVQVPGSPALNVGGRLIAGGPYITSIEVQLSIQGATTTYHMKTWTPTYGKIAKQNAERFKNISRAGQRQRRAIRDLYNANRLAPAKFLSAKIFDTPANDLQGQTGKTTHILLGGDVVENSGENSVMPVTVSRNNLVIQSTEGHAKKVYNSWDWLFTPFSTLYDETVQGTESSGIPGFTEPANGRADSFNVDHWNPLQGETGFKIISRSVTRPDDIALNKQNLSGYRAFAHRLPMIGAGTGYDVEGYPVPNANDNYPDDKDNEFKTGYQTNIALHKVGPIELVWDHHRGVWTAPDRHSKIGKLTHVYDPSTMTYTTDYGLSSSDNIGRVQIWFWNGLDGQFQDAGYAEDFCVCWLIKNTTKIIPIGASVVMQRINGTWNITEVICLED